MFDKFVKTQFKFDKNVLFRRCGSYNFYGNRPLQLVRFVLPMQVSLKFRHISVKIRVCITYEQTKGGIPETSIGKTKDTSLSLEIYGKISQINDFSSTPSANFKEFFYHLLCKLQHALRFSLSERRRFSVHYTQDGIISTTTVC